MADFVNPSMLRLGRESRGYTQKDLSEYVGKSQGAIARAENGQLPISSRFLDNLSKVLNYPPKFFFQTFEPVGSISVFHRKNYKLPVKVKKKIEAEANVRRFHATILNSISNFKRKSFINQIPSGSPESVAQSVRKILDVPKGPIDNICDVAERLDIVVYICNFHSNLIDGFSYIDENKFSYIFINKLISGDRFRFTLAHEMGHILMHSHPTKTMEKEANRFASELLMPENSIIKDLNDIDIYKLVELKAKWRLSMQSLLMKAMSLNLINESKYNRLWKEFNFSGFRRSEPIMIEVDQPRLFTSMIQFFLENLDYGLEDICNALNCSLEDFKYFYEDHLKLVRW